MRLYLPGGMLKRRPADIDVSDLTAKPAGEARWEPGDILDWPFAPEPSPAEQALIERRLTTDTSVEEDLHKRATDAYQGLVAYENLTTPTNAQTVAAVRLLCKVARALIRLQLRQLDKTD